MRYGIEPLLSETVAGPGDYRISLAVTNRVYVGEASGRGRHGCYGPSGTPEVDPDAAAGCRLAPSSRGCRFEETLAIHGLRAVDPGLAGGRV